MNQRSRDRPRSACPELFQLLGAYLHQDFDLDYPDARAALLTAIDESTHERLAAALRELVEHRPAGELAAKRFANNLCDYHPPADGLTNEKWLVELESELVRAIDASM